MTVNVCLVCSKYPPEYSGSGLRSHKTFKRLTEKYDLDFIVLAGSVTGNRCHVYEYEGTKVHCVADKWNVIIHNNISAPFSIRFTKRIIKYLFFIRNYWFEAFKTIKYLCKERSRFDVIHVVGKVNVTAAAILYAKITKTPIAIELVNLMDSPHPYEPMLISLLWGKGFPKQAKLVCISERLRQQCLDFGYPEHRIWCRPNPVDEKKFFYESHRREKYRSLLNIDKGEAIRLVYLAKFRPLKNQRFLLDVMKLLPENYRLTLVGPTISSGPLFKRQNGYFKEVHKTIKDYDIGHRVEIIAKFVDNPEAYIKSADVFVMPTTSEAFGTPLFEAMASGVPVVVNEMSGVFDQWVQNGVNGYICELDANKWADRIIRCTKFADDALAQTATALLKTVSTSSIDRQYFQEFKALTQ